MDERTIPILYLVVPCYNEEEIIEKSAQVMSDKLRRMMQENGRQIHISVDGGIKLENFEEAVRVGADVLVMGTGFFRSEEPEKLMDLIARLEEQGCGL